MKPATNPGTMLQLAALGVLPEWMPQGQHMNQAKLMGLIAEYTANTIAAQNLKPMDDGPIANTMRGLVIESRMKLDYAMTEVFDELETLRAAQLA